MEVGPLTAFVVRVVERLRTTARRLFRQGRKDVFYSLLKGELFNIGEYLEDFGDAFCKPAGRRRLLDLLENLEMLCQSLPPIGPPYGQVELPTPTIYPNLTQILENETLADDVVARIATSSRQTRGTLLKILKDFSNTEETTLGPELFELLGSHKVLGEEDKSAYIQTLYSTLASHCRCHNQAIRADITTNLLLNCRGTLEDRPDSASFRLFFLHHPHDHSNNKLCQWQDAQVCVLRQKEVKFETEQPSSYSSYDDALNISMGNFCEHISQSKSTQLQLAISDNGLILRGNGPLSKNFTIGTSSISLGDLLSIPGIEISSRMRLLLSYFLVKAVWQFYGSDWMRREWTRDTVHFMVERSLTTPKGISLKKPFLSTRFDGLESTERDDIIIGSHSLPTILALGIMLIEIALGKKIEDYWSQEWLQTNEQLKRNLDHAAAIEVLGQTKLWNDTFNVVKEAIKICITANFFYPHEKDTYGVRNILEERVVLPIQKLYQDAWGDPEETILDMLEINDFIGMPNPHVIPQKRPIDDEHTERKRIRAHQTELPLPGGVMSGSTSDASSETWFKRLEAFTSALRLESQVQDVSYRPTKIAVLDTGVSDQCSKWIRDYKDFVDQTNDKYLDNTGHGTCAVQLIRKVYNRAELYIGRVFEYTEEAVNTSLLMVEAIKHARKIWKVDIIVIASGFPKSNNDMRDAIDEAGRDSILIFAAASNSGNSGGVTFPGQLYVHNKLLCMFSTDANARCSPFNPSACLGARYSFAIFGEKVDVSPTIEPLSGTSYATMIGAAIAGRILDFSRHSDVSNKIREIRRLSSVEGMSAVFAVMANDAVDNGYHCVTPWKILPSEVADEDTAASRVRAREYVRETISRALENL